MRNNHICTTDITPELIEQHGLTQEEFQRILDILGRQPTLTELGIYSVMWSEHCSYKSSRIHLKKFPTNGPRILQGPGENAGIIDIGNGLAIVMKIESHNHPSAVEPYQGAATGVGGIIRDIFTMGARPIASLNSLRFGQLNDPKSKHLLSGVVAGIAGYGNCMGIPTVAGEVYFEETYRDNCLVNVMCVGLVKTDKIYKAIACGKDNPIIYVGSTTGRDGIHGCTFASEELDEHSQEDRPSVQVGDPFMEKKLLEACLELMKQDYIVGIQDMGAAGLTCSSCEMPAKGRSGIEIDVAKVPRRATGMTPYEVMLSESQERMLICGKKGYEQKIKQIFAKWDLEAVVIGKVRTDGMMRIKDGNQIVAEIPVSSLTDDAPVYNRPAKKPKYIDTLQSVDLSKLREPNDYNQVLLRLLNSPNIGSKQWIYEQYDHMVRTNTIVLPGQGDAAVLRIKKTNTAIAVTTDGNGRYCYLDPNLGGRIAVAEAARNCVCVGAKPIAITDCLNFGNPEKPEIMWQFIEAVNGIAEACKTLGTPVTGGNVSFYNETEGVAIYPTPVIGMLGLIEHYQSNPRRYTTFGFKHDSDYIVLLGETKEELGGSEYLKVIHNRVAGKPPSLDLEKEMRLHQAVLTAIAHGFIHSAHDCAEGGLAVALAECCLAGNIGAKVNLPAKRFMPSVALFSESQSRIIVSVAEKNLTRLEKIMLQYHVPMTVLGLVGGKQLHIGLNERGRGRRDHLIDIPISELHKAYYSAIQL
ncbi:MAG: phosphoribosylformylglycinamidine synthase subunit PurL [bacterium]|nr:phosphoribosylformylglycinamidine synthase subunit PurL [bacterium]